MILRFDGWNVYVFAGADSWISRFSAKCWQNVHFGMQKSSNLVDYASQKSKSSWNGSSEELFEVWVVGSTQFFSANLAVILVFSQTLINDELWIQKNRICFFHVLIVISRYSSCERASTVQRTLHRLEIVTCHLIAHRSLLGPR